MQQSGRVGSHDCLAVRHHSKKLVPASEMFDVTISIVFVHDSSEFIVVQKLYQLSENIFVLIHLKPFDLVSKVQFQIVALYK
ncbi:hypothetical protein BACCOP_02883 [Phocaeicola coprocola DSM 17136]|uniref:Uncharacterized protein n=1 Tax=Phocaeicola coprocola DSM 17136 TaxID=470145 RepID=B3JLT6_9BACT|nr:hypothetical protein BACCOP_02883 [Phocaeicola coprocola DSM 17136]